MELDIKGGVPCGAIKGETSDYLVGGNKRPGLISLVELDMQGALGKVHLIPVDQEGGKVRFRGLSRQSRSGE